MNTKNDNNKDNTNTNIENIVDNILKNESEMGVNSPNTIGVQTKKKDSKCDWDEWHGENGY